MSHRYPEWAKERRRLVVWKAHGKYQPLPVGFKSGLGWCFEWDGCRNGALGRRSQHGDRLINAHLVNLDQLRRFLTGGAR